MPDALLYGERGGVPPEGFDAGNSPREAWRAAGRRVIFTTTTGAQWLVRAWGAPAVYMGTTLNANAVIGAAMRRENDVVLIPAGLADDPSFSAQEDWVAAAAIAMSANAPVDEGVREYEYWAGRIESEGIAALFAGAPHAEKLRRVHLDADIEYCARMNITTAVPMAVEKSGMGIVVRNLAAQD
jgi:2-phosphosulfolactate phosphatase